MGQVQSDVADSPPPPPHQSERLSSSSPETNQPASMESLIAVVAIYPLTNYVVGAHPTSVEIRRPLKKSTCSSGPVGLEFGRLGTNLTFGIICTKWRLSSLNTQPQEAAAYGNDENASLDAKAQKALECPCISDLRKGPCGTQFSEAFLCFLKSTSEEKGSDCVHPFVALQSCIKANPNAFSKDVLDDDENEVKKEVEATQEYRVIPPIWSVESQKPKPKL